MGTDKTWQNHYLDRFYRTRKNWINGTHQFHDLILNNLSSDSQILEIGPGPKNQTSAFLSGQYTALDGLDVDKDAMHNPFLRRIMIYDGNNWPIEDSRYHAVVADYVLEHLEIPSKTVAEAFRVLRPGGLFVFRTPNLWHYVSMVSFFTPHWFHNLIANRLRSLESDSHDPWPTYYRMNTCRNIRLLLHNAGFNEVELVLIEKEPSYGMYSRILFWFFMAYERFVNSSKLFSMFRANILGVFVKPHNLP